MVGVLRDGAEPDLAPPPGIDDVERLARDLGGWPRVGVHLSGNLDDLPPAVGVALYRIAQEAVTNAMRHARNATRVTVEVGGVAERVRLTVRDDGDAVTGNDPTPGYGLLGMTERTSLLGGTVQAALPPREAGPSRRHCRRAARRRHRLEPRNGRRTCPSACSSPTTRTSSGRGSA
jgi:signal transduction histidine kinase